MQVCLPSGPISTPSQPLVCFGVGNFRGLRRQIVEQPPGGGHRLKHALVSGRLAGQRLHVGVRPEQELRQPLDPRIVRLGVRQLGIVAERAAVPADQHELVGDEVLAKPAELGRFAEGLGQPILNFVGVALDGLLRTLEQQRGGEGERHQNRQRVAREERLRFGHCAIRSGVAGRVASCRHVQTGPTLRSAVLPHCPERRPDPWRRLERRPSPKSSR